MALTPYQFTIHQGNPVGAYAAGRQNRLAQMGFEQRASRDAFDRNRLMRQEQRQEQRVSREDQLRAMQMAAQGYQRAAALQDPAARDQAIAGLRRTLESVFGPEAVSDFTPRFEQAEYDALVPLMEQAAPRELPAAVRTAQWLSAEATPAERQAFMDARRAGASSVVVGGQPFELRDTPQGLAAISVNPSTGEAEVKIVAERPGTAETEIERAQARRQVGEAPLADAISDYRTAVEGASTVGGVVPPGAQRQALNQRRRALVAMVAKNILGTPGAEPSPALYQQAEELVPDFSGAFDRSNVGAMLDTLESMLATRQAEEQEARTTPLEDDTGPTRVPVDGDVTRIASDAEYDALPSGARFVGPDGIMREKP